MNRNGNNRASGINVLEDTTQEGQTDAAFYHPSNPVFAPAKESTTSKKRRWKRKLIGWGFVALLLVVSGFVLYALLKINRVDVKVLADNRRDGAGKTQSSANNSENGLSAEAINIAREAIGSDSSTVKASASPITSPETSNVPANRLNYSSTVNPGMGPATYFGPSNSTQPVVASTQVSSKDSEESTSETTIQSRANATQSIFVDDVPKQAAVPPKTSNVNLAANLSNKPAKSKQPSMVLPPFGTMLPVRTQAVILTMRNNSYARLELTRDLKGEGWSLSKGTILIGHTGGSEADRAVVNVIGYLDRRENRLVKMTGEVLGADGGLGLQGKRVEVDRNRFKQTLSKVASSGLQVAGMMAGALTGRGTVVLNGAGYRVLNPITGEADQFLNGGNRNRTFVKVEAGQPGFVMVADLPKEIRAVDAPGDDELEKAATSLTDREVMELILFGTPEEIRAALPMMNEEQRTMVSKTTEIQTAKP